MLDPCPNDLGRDVELMAKVAQKTGFQIICATGLYKEAEGGTAYWKFRNNFGGIVETMAELFVKELSEGIGSTGVRAGIIKVATGHQTLTDYEKWVFEAAARDGVAPEREGELLKKIGELTVERDFLSNGLARFR